MTQVDTNWGKVTLRYRKDGNGMLDKAAKTAFTRGYCHCFAAELHKETGWQMYGIGGNPEYPGHYIVYDPVLDDYVDIGGTGALKRWQFLADIYIGPAEIEDIPPVPLYRPLDLELAKPFVASVLEKINKPLTMK